MPNPLPCQRQLFDIPEGVAYFNCAYMSPLLRTAVAAGHQGVANKSQPWRVRPADFFSLPDQARGLFAGLIGAQADDIAIVGSASYGIETALKNIRLQAGDKVLTSTFTLSPVPGAIAHAGAEAVLVETSADYITDMADLEHKAASSGAKVFLLSHMRGHIADLQAVQRSLRLGRVRPVSRTVGTLSSRSSQ